MPTTTFSFVYHFVTGFHHSARRFGINSHISIIYTVSRLAALVIYGDFIASFVTLLSSYHGHFFHFTFTHLPV